LHFAPVCDNRGGRAPARFPNVLASSLTKGQKSPLLRKTLLLLLLAPLCGCTYIRGTAGGDRQGQTTVTVAEQIPVYSYEIKHVYPHDPAAFTQGLIFRDGLLWESTGLNGESSLRKVELETGRVIKKIDVPQQFFAEGMTVFKGRVYQLTWQSQRAFVYDPENFQKLNEFAYEGEGWGLTHDGDNLIMSDGTNRLRFLDPETFAVRRAVSVTAAGRPVNELNELEYVNGEVYANIWRTDRVARIDPRTGRVVGWIDLTGLLPANEHSAITDVLNGIAYDAAGDRLFVTGKLWPRLFEIRLVKK
jgi:glutaminyl-peptide cyclotransferase